MAVVHKVTAAAAVVRVGGTERYLYHGSTLPAGVSAEDIKRLIKMGLVSKVTVKAATDTPAEVPPGTPAGAPAGTGSDK